MSLIWSLVAAAVAGFDDKMSFAAAVARRREDAAAVIDENAVIDMTAVLDLLSDGVPASRPPRPVPRPVPLPIAQKMITTPAPHGATAVAKNSR